MSQRRMCADRRRTRALQPPQQHPRRPSSSRRCRPRLLGISRGAREPVERQKSCGPGMYGVATARGQRGQSPAWRCGFKLSYFRIPLLLFSELLILFPELFQCGNYPPTQRLVILLQSAMRGIGAKPTEAFQQLAGAQGTRVCVIRVTINARCFMAAAC